MSTGSISILTAPTHAPVRKSGFRFELAVPDDNAELLRFSRNAEMPGAIRFSFDRSPDYLGALCVEAGNRKCSSAAKRRPGAWWPSAIVQSSRCSSTASPRPLAI